MKDLNTFKERFSSDRCRPTKNGLEYTGQNLDSALPQAKKIIQDLGLNLIARTVDDMAANRRFEVIIKD